MSFTVIGAVGAHGGPVGGRRHPDARPDDRRSSCGPADRAYRDAARRRWVRSWPASRRTSPAATSSRPTGAEDESRTAFVRLAYQLRQARKSVQHDRQRLHRGHDSAWPPWPAPRSSTPPRTGCSTAACRSAGSSPSSSSSPPPWRRSPRCRTCCSATSPPGPASAPCPSRSRRRSGPPHASADAGPARTPPAPSCSTASAFTYPGTARQVLHGVDLTIPAGATVAVVGPTGAGKSSIAKLVGRRVRPRRGRRAGRRHGCARVGAHLVPPAHRRSCPRTASASAARVAENIAYGRPDADRADIEAAAAAVGALDAVLGLVGGLDARVEEEGRNLTAAQVQLIALARAWLTTPRPADPRRGHLQPRPRDRAPVLAATRAMDCTTIMVTHRLPVAQSADTVLVVAEGAVVEIGAARRAQAAPERRLRRAVGRRPRGRGPRRRGGHVRADRRRRGRCRAHPGRSAGAGRGPRDRPPACSRTCAPARSAPTPTRSTTAAVRRPAASPATAAMAGMVIGETDEELEAFLVGAGGVEAMAHSILDALRSAIDPAVVGDLTVAFEVGDGEAHHRWVLSSATDAGAATLERADGRRRAVAAAQRPRPAAPRPRPARRHRRRDERPDRPGRRPRADRPPRLDLRGRPRPRDGREVARRRR